MPRSIEAFSLILLESLRSLEEPALADMRLLKVDLLPAHRSPPPHPYRPRRFLPVPDLFEFYLDFNYFAFLALDRRDTLGRSQLIRANVPLLSLSLAAIYFSPWFPAFISADLIGLDLLVPFSRDIFLRASIHLRLISGIGFLFSIGRLVIAKGC